MSARVRKVGGGLLGFECPGCGSKHMVRIAGEIPGPRWHWDGNEDHPTLTPSVRVQGRLPLSDEAYDAWLGGATLPEPVETLCHSFVKAGRIQFLDDCTHDLANQTVPLPPFDRDD